MHNKALMLGKFPAVLQVFRSAALNQNCQIFKEADYDENQHKR